MSDRHDSPAPDTADSVPEPTAPTASALTTPPGWAAPGVAAPVPSPGIDPSWGAPPQAPPPATAGPAAVQPTASKPGAGLSITAMVLGGIAALLALIPFACFAAFIPAIAGVVIGVVALARRGRLRGLAIAGVSVSAAALAIEVVMSIVTGFLVTAIADDVEKSGGFESWVEDEGGTAGLPSSSGTELRGTGRDTVTVAPYDGVGQYGLAHITSNGTGSFIVIGRDAAGKEVERVVDAPAPYDGIVLWNLSTDYEITSFELVTDGDWTITISSVDDVPEVTEGSTHTGSGDAVFWYGGSDTQLTLTPSDDALGYLWSTSSQEPWLCESQGDPCTAELPGDGGAYVQILSDGDWTLRLGR